ncbi:MAG: PAS domain-containing protein [Gemmatimonadaceae bacterium]|nr:PAS domain-containing protein [Gemmatimonadaceae bacterium]
MMQQNDVHYRTLAEAIPQIVWTANPDGWLDFYNQRWFDYTGLTLEQTEGWGWEPVLHPDDLQQCIRQWTQAFSTGEPYEMEYRFKRAADGEYRWHLGRALPVRDADGAIVKWFGTCTDIHDQKEAAEVLRQSRDALEALVVARTAALAESEAKLVTLCAWSNTVRYDGEWMTFSRYLESRFGLMTTHGISPNAIAKFEAEDQVSAADALTDPKRLAAVRAIGLLDTLPMAGFDRITRLGARVLNVPATFISLVDDHRDFYLSHCGFGEPLASERQLAGQTFCHFTIQGELPLIIPDTRADPVYAKVPTVESLGVAAYLGVPLVLLSGEVIGAFCAIDFAPHAWNEAQVLAATDLASLVVSEIELRQAAFDFQRDLR